MLTKRVIVCLDVRAGRVVKGVKFQDLRDLGDAVEAAARYEREGADEIVFLDIAASTEARTTLLAVVRATAERLFIPLTVGGGVRTADGVADVLRAGADKVSLNTAAVERPELITEAAARFGSQCVVVSLDAARGPNGWQIFTKGGRQPTGLDALTWAGSAVQRGAGELLVTSIDRDGVRSGYDLELTRAIAERVPVPVIASGGAGRAEHLAEAFTAGADAALVAGIVHDGVTTVRQLKEAMIAAGVPTRRTW